jgi:hypothetical protein
MQAQRIRQRKKMNNQGRERIVIVTHSRRPALKDELRRAIEAGRRA